MTPTLELVRSLRLLAKFGNKNSPYMLTLNEAADRLEELDERVAIMSETEVIPSEER